MRVILYSKGVVIRRSCLTDPPRIRILPDTSSCPSACRGLIFSPKLFIPTSVLGTLVVMIGQSVISGECLALLAFSFYVQPERIVLVVVHSHLLTTYGCFGLLLSQLFVAFLFSVLQTLARCQRQAEGGGGGSGDSGKGGGAKGSSTTTRKRSSDQVMIY